MLFGAHVSVAAGYAHAVEYATEVGCETMQIFAKSPRQWVGPPLAVDTAAEFKSARQRLSMGPVFTHTAYLINLTTTDAELRDKSIRALADELVRGAALECDGVVTHSGSDPACNSDEAAARLGAAAARSFDLAGPAALGTRLLLENTAGAGTIFGCDWSQLGRAVAESGLPPSRLGVCLDTCHAFAYGYPLNTAEGWRRMMDAIGRHVGFDRLGLVHSNDSLFEAGSRKDRHAWIGDGYIGTEGFSEMIRVPELADVPCVCEVAGDKPVKDVTNIERLKHLRAGLT